MTVPSLAGSAIPLGRWQCETADVETAFVNGQSQTRQEIWHDWLDVTSAVRQAVGAVAACWFSGSFLTDKLEPADIDCVFIIRRDLLNSALTEPRTAWFMQQVAKSQMKLRGIKVDSYVLPWDPQPGVQPLTAGHNEYLKFRGYWDDLWGRMKDHDPRIEMQPRRGYLEVSLDGYQ